MAQLGDNHSPFRSNASAMHDVGATIDPGIPAELTDAEIDQLWNELFGTPDPIIAQAEEIWYMELKVDHHWNSLIARYRELRR